MMLRVRALPLPCRFEVVFLQCTGEGESIVLWRTQLQTAMKLRIRPLRMQSIASTWPVSDERVCR